MSDSKYFQKGFTKQLAHVVEEAGEMLAAAGKTQRWGLKSFNPELPFETRETNEVWLHRELLDLQQAVARLLLTMNGESIQGTWCAECGPQVGADEDGLCVCCGATAVGRGANAALRLLGDP